MRHFPQAVHVVVVEDAVEPELPRSGRRPEFIEGRRRDTGGLDTVYPQRVVASRCARPFRGETEAYLRGTGQIEPVSGLPPLPRRTVGLEQERLLPEDAAPPFGADIHGATPARTIGLDDLHEQLRCGAVAPGLEHEGIVRLRDARRDGSRVDVVPGDILQVEAQRSPVGSPDVACGAPSRGIARTATPPGKIAFVEGKERAALDRPRDLALDIRAAQPSCAVLSDRLAECMPAHQDNIATGRQELAERLFCDEGEARAVRQHQAGELLRA